MTAAAEPSYKVCRVCRTNLEFLRIYLLHAAIFLIWRLWFTTWMFEDPYTPPILPLYSSYTSPILPLYFPILPLYFPYTSLYFPFTSLILPYTSLYFPYTPLYSPYTSPIYALIFPLSSMVVEGWRCLCCQKRCVYLKVDVGECTAGLFLLFYCFVGCPLRFDNLQNIWYGTRYQSLSQRRIKIKLNYSVYFSTIHTFLFNQFVILTMYS